MGMVVSYTHQQIQACLRYLAAHHDGERHGFRRVDATFGRQLAEVSQLTLAQIVVGAKLLRKYRRQLEAAELRLPTPHEIEAYLTAQQPPAPARQGELRPSLVPGTSINQVSILQGRLVVKYAYDRVKYAAMATLKEKVPGCVFNLFGLGEWSFPIRAVATVLEALKPFRDFVYSDDIPSLVEWARAKKELARQQARLQKTLAELERQAALDAVQPFLNGEPVANGQVLFAHQREAVQCLIERKRVILAHDLGLGKTRSALMAAKGYELPVMVICPASLRINWLREAEVVQVPIQVYSWAKLPEPPEDDDYILIADECFPYETQVFTDCGLLPIGEIVEKALPISVLSYNIENESLEWMPITRYVKRSLQGHLIRVVHEYGSFVCTPNHRIWTEEHGYVEASLLQGGASLRMLPEGISREQQRKEHSQVLQQVVCESDQQQQIRKKRGGSSTYEQASYHKNMCMVQLPIFLSLDGDNRERQATLLQQALRQLLESQPSGKQRILTPAHQACTPQNPWEQASRCLTAHEAEQSNEPATISGENEAKAHRQNLSLSWREWRTCSTATSACTSIEITYRVPHTDRSGKRTVPLTSSLLQSRYSQPGTQDSYRSRRQDTQGETLEIPRSAQNGGLACSRVVRVEIYQSENFDRVESGGCGNQSVYNLEILGNHNYFADDVLVSNCHYAQTLKAKRTQGFLRLAEHARAMYALTGTPMKNGPINLYPLLLACKHPLAQDKRAYEQRYCNAHLRRIGRGRLVYDVSGASNLEELHAKTCDVLLYKKKEECLKDLPPKLRIMRQADVSQEAKRAYQAKVDQLRQKHQQRMQQKWAERATTSRQDLGVTEATLDQEMDGEQGEAIVELEIERQAGSLIKVQSAIEIAQEVLKQGESIVLFTAFLESAHKIADALEVECLSGESDPSGGERQAIIDRFQAKEKRALVCLIGTGGIGHTLTAAQTVVLVDRPWTPTEAQQCEDRLHRIGQRGSVTAIWLQYGPIDKRIDALLQQKQERIDLVVEGERKDIRSLAREILESARQGTPIEHLLDLVHQLDRGKEQHRENIDGDTLVAHSGQAQEQSDLAGFPGLPTEAQPIESSSHGPGHVALSASAENHMIETEHQAQAEAQKKDRRLKGEVPRIRVNIMLDEQVVAFLRSMKASNQTSSKEGGYSGFLERLVKESEEFQAYLQSQE